MAHRLDWSRNIIIIIIIIIITGSGFTASFAIPPLKAPCVDFVALEPFVRVQTVVLKIPLDRCHRRCRAKRLYARIAE